MRLTPLTPEDVYRLVSKALANEVTQINARLSKADGMRDLNKKLINDDVVGVRNSIESLKLNLALAKSDANTSQDKALGKLRGELDNIDLRQDISVIQNRVRQMGAGLLELVRPADAVQGSALDDDRFDIFLDEIKRLEDLIRRARPQAYALTNGNNGGGAVEIQYDGVTVSDSATCLNFTGTDVLVAPNPDNPDCLDIYIPPPAFALQFINCAPGLVEVGLLVSEVALSWSWTIAVVIDQLLTGPGTYAPVADSERARLVTLLNNDQTNQTWTIAAKDPLTGLTDNGSCSLRFGAIAYFGKGPVPTNEAEVLAFTPTGIQTGHGGTLAQPTSGAPQYMIYAYPAAWGALGTVIDPQTGFEIPTVQESDVEVTNVNGYKLNYSVYRSFQQTAGAFTWTFASSGPVQLPPSLP